jgi:multiple sugar transport system permease protein
MNSPDIGSQVVVDKFAGQTAIGSGRESRSRQRTWINTAMLIAGYLVMIAMAVLSLFPFLWMISTSLKTMSSVFAIPPELIPDPILWSNYADVFREFPFFRFTWNTIFVTVTVTIGQLLTCSMAAYAFARMKFRGRDTVFLFYLGTMMIPYQVTLIPTYVLMARLGWVDRYESLIIPGILGGVYGTFLIRQSFLTVPQELEDAAVIDGASPIWIFRSIMIPLSKPILATYAVFTFMWTWNDFLWPLLMINTPDNMTLTLGINLMARGRYTTDWPHLMAGTCMSILPSLVVLAFAQRYFVQGITLTGLKV